jgi:glycosyltransferase involved in cell wall biosynthesis
MLKILYVSAAAERGGQEVVLLNIVKGLERSRFTPLVLFLEEGPFVREVQDVGVETNIIKAGRVRNLLMGVSAITAIRKLIKQKGIHLVHTHNAKAHLYGGLAATLAHVPCVYHLQGVPKFSISRDGVVSLLSVVVPTYRTIACSRYVAQAFRQAWRFKREIIVVHSGVTFDTSIIPNCAPTVREEFGIPDGVPLIVMACRLQWWKGVHVFLDAAALVLETSLKAYFLIVGGTLFGLEEHYAASLRAQADRLGLTNATIFTGYRPDPYRFLAAADLVIHSSIYPDPLPTVILEAMTLGKPVVASYPGGTGEIIEADVTGLLVPPERPDRLAEAILTLLNDSDRRLRMGRAGALRAHERFRAERMIAELEQIYLEVLGLTGA